MLGFAVPSSAGHGSPRLLIIVSEIFRSSEQWVRIQLVLWDALESIDVEEVRSSGEEYNFLVVEVLRCGVIIDPIPKEQLAQYAAEAAAALTSGPVIVSPHANHFAIIPTPFNVTLYIRGLHDLANACNFGLNFTQPLAMMKALTNMLRLLHLPDLLLPRREKVRQHLWVVLRPNKGGLREPTPKDVVEVADPALMPLGLLIPDKDYGDFVGCDGHYFHWELGDLVGHFMIEPCNACNEANVQCQTIRSGSSNCFRTVNKACQVFMPHPALVKDLCVRFAQVLDEATWIADYQGKVPTALHCQHSDNVEQLLGLFELGVKEWKDLATVGDEAFEAEGDDKDENEGGPSSSQEEAD
ncbi:hypothetical protein EDD18DRAFT_1100608 [Armillaria luteobubalina]|uniref:Uncharacterized protein n=1 Tax=Armillaria luteobubalina TaxID=153913 RepID=A0AA39QFS5_9AGAR|nr:hypothetical protein EDD18DRAFT_1100608 [Armillaria luteobubalina]